MFDKSRWEIRVQLNHRTPPTMKLLKEDYSLDFTGSIGNNRKSQIQRSIIVKRSMCECVCVCVLDICFMMVFCTLVGGAEGNNYLSE